MIPPSRCLSRQPDAATETADEHRSYTTSRDPIEDDNPSVGCRLLGWDDRPNAGMRRKMARASEPMTMSLQTEPRYTNRNQLAPVLTSLAGALRHDRTEIGHVVYPGDAASVT